METAEILLEIKKKLDKIGREPFWVSSAIIVELTGWDNNRMVEARRRNPKWYRIIKKGKRYEYDASLLPEVLITKNETDSNNSNDSLRVVQNG